MAFFSWSRWFRSLLRPQVKPIRRRSRSLSFEQLENRLAPASFTWTGAANDGKWTTPGNWSGNMAPTGIASNLEDLTFQGSPQTANNTFVNATFNSITIASPSFILTGNSLTLGSTLTNGSGRITVNAGLLGEQIGFAIGLGGGGTTGQQVVTVNSNSVLTINGKISGSGIGLTKQGGGTMTLAADDSGFSGSFTIAAGVVQLNNDK